MRFSFASALLALQLLAGIAHAAEPAADDTEFSVDTAALRREYLAEIHGEMQRTDRLAAECERQGFPEAKTLRRALERARPKHAERLEAARAAYEDAASADKRRMIEDGHAALFAGLKSRPALRKACRSAAKEAAGLDGMLRDSFALLEVVASATPAPEADPTGALSREQLLSLLRTSYVDLELTTAECERRGLSEAGILRRALSAVRQAHGKELAEAEGLFKSGAGFVPYEQGLKQIREHEQTLRQQSAQEMQELCRGLAEQATKGDGDFSKAFGFDQMLSAIAAARPAAEPAQP